MKELEVKHAMVMSESKVSKIVEGLEEMDL